MFPLLVVALACVFLRLFSRFGSPLAARRSPIWSLLALFLLAAAIRPEFFAPVAPGRSSLAEFSSIRYMIKMTSALAGFRLRSLLGS